jgi:hypothetical protein
LPLGQIRSQLEQLEQRDLPAIKREYEALLKEHEHLNLRLMKLRAHS